MNISVNHPQATSDYDRRNVDFNTSLEELEICRSSDDVFEYLDTPRGTLRRYLCYWQHSPYGWEAVSWG